MPDYDIRETRLIIELSRFYQKREKYYMAMWTYSLTVGDKLKMD